MATAQTILDRALRLIHQLPTGGSATGSQASEGLIALNAMVESWRNEALMAFALQEETLALPATTASRTIGPTGNLVTTRPVEIVMAYVTVSSIDYDIKIILREQYATLPDKTSTADWPSRLAYEPTMDNGTIYFYPLASSARSIKLITRIPVLAFATIGTAISLPPGWEEALATNLAINLASEYETDPRAEVVRMARESKAGIKRTNTKRILASTDLPALVGGGMRTSIITNQP